MDRDVWVSRKAHPLIMLALLVQKVHILTAEELPRSAKAHHLVKRKHFQNLIHQIANGSVTIEMSLID